jgi:hypothetical protein
LIVELADYSPVASPSLDRQRDALHKGLGRAMIWATTGCLNETILLDACLHDWRFDRSVEEYRGDWLWQLIQAIDAEDRFRPTIFKALSDLAEDDAAQLCQLSFHYAINGDEAFRSHLYKIVQDKPFADMRYLGEEEIIRLGGEDAFLLALGIRGRQLEDRDWEWDDSVLIDDAIKHLGEERVNDLVEATADKDVKRLCDRWRQEKSNAEQKEASGPTSLKRTRQLSASQVIAAVESTVKNCATIRIWGRHANDDDLGAVFEYLLSAHDPKVISNCLLVFLSREFPRIVPELVSLSQHSDAEVRRRAISALESNSHPLVRQLAEDELKRGMPDGLALGLFIKNYQDGDEQRIIDLAQLPNDAEQQHWLLKDATKILEENPNADCSHLGVAAYALIPCSFCRYCAAKLLRDRHVAPVWLIEECRFDSKSDTQKLFLGP